MREKTCSGCKKVKNISEFHMRPDRGPNSVRYICKACSASKTKEWQQANRESANRIARKWQKSHPEQKKSSVKKWMQEHPEAAKAMQKRAHAKHRKSIKVRISESVSNKIWFSLRETKARRGWQGLVGYTIDELKAHLEKQFKPGMSWDNYGSCWHIDHIAPRAAFNFSTPEDIDFKRCWALSNLRPLEAEKNWKKGSRLERPFQPSLTI